MVLDIKLKIVIIVCLILLLNSLPTKQDRKYGLVRSRVKANLRTSDVDEPPPSSGNKIGETIEEPEVHASPDGDAKTVKGNIESSEGNGEKQDVTTSDVETIKENAQHSDKNAKSSAEIKENGSQSSSELLADENCWINFNVSEYFSIMDKIEAKYLTARKSFDTSTTSDLNDQMMSSILGKKGAAVRALHNTAGEDRIPAGLNLGGHALLYLNGSVLFFHRMKLRNNTVFHINKLENNLMDMTLNADLFLNDLHLVGAYERSTVGKDPSILHHAATFGELEILMKEVSYSMEGRLRLQNQRLVMDIVNSELNLQNNNVLITYSDSNQTKPIILPQREIGIFLSRMTNDLDHWLKDFFNDYYIYHKLNLTNNADLVNYESERMRAYNKFTTYALGLIKKRIFEHKLYQVAMPNFTLISFPDVEMKLFDGSIYGFETIHRKSKTTGMKKDNLRIVDVLVEFGKIKAEYSLVVKIPNQGEVAGHLVYTTNNIAAKLRLEMTKESNETEITMTFYRDFSPESMVVEGAASQFTPHFRHLIETEAITLMSSMVNHHINQLGSITKCSPHHLTVANKPDAYTYNAKKRMYICFMFCHVG